MDRLWAPWRMEYILNEKPDRCIFCLEEDTSRDRERFVIHRTAHSFVMLNRYPYTNGHMLIAPRRHTSDLNALGEEELSDLFLTTRLARNVLHSVAQPQGFNIGMNLGKAAGAGVDEHLHMHIVPRWNGDTNYMTVVADLRIMPENLATTYSIIAEGFARAVTGT